MRVNCSVLESEVMAFTDAFDMAYVSKHDLQLITKCYILLKMLTDSFSLFDILTIPSSNTKKAYIDLQIVHNAYNKSEVRDAAYIRSEYNNATALRKVGKQSILVETILKSLLNQPVQQSIIRSVGIDLVVKEREC